MVSTPVSFSVHENGQKSLGQNTSTVKKEKVRMEWYEMDRRNLKVIIRTES